MFESTREQKSIVELALIRLKNKNLALTKDNITYIIDMKPASISDSRWWAMLNTVKLEKQNV